jgi:hypothetical protein
MKEIVVSMVYSALALIGVVSSILSATLLYLYLFEDLDGVPILFFLAPVMFCLTCIFFWKSTKARAWVTSWLVPWWGW